MRGIVFSGSKTFQVTEKYLPNFENLTVANYVSAQNMLKSN